MAHRHVFSFLYPYDQQLHNTKGRDAWFKVAPRFNSMLITIWLIPVFRTIDVGISFRTRLAKKVYDV
jgi:hypothetical protein